MRKNKWCLPAALAALLLAGCSLARPEAADSEDRFAGLYVVREEPGAPSLWDSGNPLLTEYGSTAIDGGAYGGFDVPNYVLFAREEDGSYIFPGLEGGYSLFIVHKTEDYGSVAQLVSDMAPDAEGWHTTVTGEGDEESFGGVIYCGAPLGVEDWDQWDGDQYWQIHRVYQTEDGRVYLSRGGNGVGGNGGFGYSESHDWTRTENGKSVTDHIEVSVKMEVVSRLEKLVVTQFDGKNAVLRSDDLALGEDLAEVRCEEGAAWVLVEEFRGDGAVRTAYNAPQSEEEAVSHQVVLLDEAGLGYLAYLEIRP